MRRSGVLALYLGGFLGPFGGGVVAAMLPEIGASFGVSAAAATATLPAYLIPFAGLMLISGTIGERWGRSRAILLAYLSYAAASVLAALAPSLPMLLAARALQGAANAFTTPLLLASLAAAVPPDRLGRSLGRYSAVAAAGQTSAPLLGGLAAEISWRWAFAGTALAAGLLALRPPRGAAGSPVRVRVRALLRPALLRIALLGAGAGACLAGLAFLVALRAGDAFGFGASARGLLLTGFGIAGLACGALVGRAVDRFGPGRACLVGCVAGGGLVAACGMLPNAGVLAACWAACGVASQLMLVSVNTLALTGVPGNRGGALSVVQALRFGGSALAPVLWLPAYQAGPALGFVLPGAVLVLLGAALLLHQPDTQQGVHSGRDGV